MSTIQQEMKKAAVNGSITLEKALAIAKKFDQEREQSKEFLTICKQNTGMIQGELIEAHLAEMNGAFFSAAEYNYERLPGEQ